MKPRIRNGPGLLRVIYLLWLQVGILVYHVTYARAVLLRVEVVVAYYHCLRVSAVQLLEQPPERCLLRLRAGVGRLAAYVEPSLVAHAYGVGIMVHAVGSCHPFRSSRLYLSVTADNVVVAYAELPVVVPAVPRVYLGGRACL